VPQIIICSNCRKKIGVPETALGKSIRCPLCQAVIQAMIAPAAPPQAVTTQAPPPVPPPVPLGADSPTFSLSAAISEGPPSPGLASHEPDEELNFSKESAAPRKRARRNPDLAPQKKWATYLGIGVGAIAAGVAFFFARAAVTSLFGGGAGIADSEWRDFTPPGENFKILMPGTPGQETRAAPGNNPMNIYKVDRDRGRISFGVLVGHLTDQDIALTPWPARFQLGQKGMVAGVPGSRLKSEKAVTVDNNPGLEFVIEVPNQGTIVARILGVREATRHSYITLMAAGPNYQETSPEVRKFLGSFAVIAK
jgi:LSD1 subclass zinc finger protein